MDRLAEYPIEDSDDVIALRQSGGAALGLALARSGCSVEAAPLLRSTRKDWSKGAHADQAVAALETITWWNKTWRDVAQARQADRYDDVLALLDDRLLRLWDQPALLSHLSHIARKNGKFLLARHLLNRLIYLSERGMPKMDMAVFDYVARASLVDVMTEEGSLDDAWAAYEKLTPNPGNAMAHQIQGASLLAKARRDEDAMLEIAEILVTANTKRSGWSADIRRDFVENADELQQLRSRPDWSEMIADPKAYLGSSQAAR